MATMHYASTSYKKEDDALVRVVKDLLDRVSALEVRIRELEYEKSGDIQL